MSGEETMTSTSMGRSGTRRQAVTFVVLHVGASFTTPVDGPVTSTSEVLDERASEWSAAGSVGRRAATSTLKRWPG